jgi:hypothetical protein
METGLFRLTSNNPPLKKVAVNCTYWVLDRWKRGRGEEGNNISHV